MNGVFYIGATGLETQQKALEIVANNIANLNTPTFKQSRAQFSQLISVKPEVDSTPSGAGRSLPTFLGVGLNGVALDFAQGPLTQSGSQLDLAINGSGFLEVLGTEGQSLLWRGGALKVNSDGYLAAANGLPLKSLISVPRDTESISISPQGRVTVIVTGSLQPIELGQIDLVQTSDQLALKAVSEGLYQPSSEADLYSATPGTDGIGVLAQGFSEASNVDLAKEMVALLLMQRSYAANSQIVQAGDQLMAIANDLRK